jgi:hypothetical protein
MPFQVGDQVLVSSPESVKSGICEGFGVIVSRRCESIMLQER